VGTTTRAKGMKVMTMSDRAGLPLTVRVAAASPHEITLAAPTLAACVVDARPAPRIGDNPSASDPLDARLAEHGIKRIAPHRSNRTKPKTQDGRLVRRYKRRWKMARRFAWRQHFQRLLVRHEYHGRELPGFCPAWLDHHPLTLVFMRWLGVV
jgi:hypothetical protein